MPDLTSKNTEQPFTFEFSVNNGPLVNVGVSCTHLHL